MNKFITYILIGVLLTACGNKTKPIDTSTTNQDTSKIKKQEKYITDTVYTNSWLDFKFAYAEAFATVDPFDYDMVWKDKEVDFSQFHDKIVLRLNTNQIQEFDRLTTGDTTYIYNTDNNEIAIADCFYPRHNIAFYSSNGKVLYYVTVCFECNRIKSNRSGNLRMKNLEKFFNYVGLPVFESPNEHGKYYDSLYVLRKKR